MKKDYRVDPVTDSAVAKTTTILSFDSSESLGFRLVGDKLEILIIAEEIPSCDAPVFHSDFYEWARNNKIPESAIDAAYAASFEAIQKYMAVQALYNAAK